jgi:HTH-type transcriptional regulator / antitoxin HigA
MEFLPDWVSPPGDTILSILEEKNESVETFSSKMGCPVEWVYRLLAGEEPIDEPIAMKLSEVVGSTCRFWLARERNYRRDKIRLGL